MSFAIRADQFEIRAECKLRSFQKRGELAMTLITSAVEMTLKYCESLSEDDLGADFIEWKDRDEIVSAFLDTGMFNKWVELVASDLREYGVQSPD